MSRRTYFGCTSAFIKELSRKRPTAMFSSMLEPSLLSSKVKSQPPSFFCRIAAPSCHVMPDNRDFQQGVPPTTSKCCSYKSALVCTGLTWHTFQVI